MPQRTLEERLIVMEKTIRHPKFRENKKLGNELGYYIFDYPAERELFVRKRIEVMKNKIDRGADGFELVVFDLYDIVINFLESRGYLEECFKMEKTGGFNEVRGAISQMFSASNENNLIIKQIKDKTPKNSVVVLTGIGKLYPLLRVHLILNNMHQVVDSVPVVLCYPGEYTGQSLCLFSVLQDENYYRAFKLVD